MLKKYLSLGFILLVMMSVLTWWVVSPSRTLNDYELRTELKQVKVSQIDAILSHYIGNSFWQLDIEKLHAEIVRLDWVYQAKVKRRWPSTVEISIVEQKPVVRWGDDALLNQNGDIFYPQEMSAFSQYVRLNGEATQSRKLLKDLVAFQSAFDGLGWTIDRLTLQADGVWIMHFSDGQKLILPPENWQKKLSRFIRALPETKADLRKYAELYDLRYSNGFVIKRAPGKGPDQREGGTGKEVLSQ